MDITPKEKRRFSLIARIKSISHGVRGIRVFVLSTHNAWIQIFVTFCVVGMGIVLKISSIEWLILILTIGFVFTTEAINTAIEIDIDLTSPEYHPYARDTKDVAAGAVLIASIIAICIGLIIFIPKIIVLF